MALKQELMAGGLASSLASKIGFDPLANIVAAGSGQASATTMVGNFVNIASGTGGILISERHSMNLIINASGSTITIYPPVGCFMNNGSVNAGVTLANGARMLVAPAGTQFFTVTSA